MSALAAAPNLSLTQMQGIAQFTGAAIVAYAPYHCPEQTLPNNPLNPLREPIQMEVTNLTE